MKQFLFRAGSDSELNEGMNRLKEYLSANKVSSTVFHLYCGLTDKELIMKQVKTLEENFPAAPIAGVASNGEIMDSKIIPQDLLVSAIVFESSKVDIYTYGNAGARTDEIGEAIKNAADKTHDLCAIELLFPGSVMKSMGILDRVSECAPNVSIFGGYPIGHDMDNDEPFVVTTKSADRDTVIAIMYSGKDLHVNADKTAGWEKLGNSFTITAADGHTLYDVDNIPALEVYEKYLKITQAGNFTRDTVEFPLLIVDNNEEILRHAATYAEDGSIYLSGNVKVGEKLYLTYGNPSGIFEQVNKRCAAIREFEPEVIFLYSCAARKAFWGDVMASREIAPFGEFGSAAGFFTGGELIRMSDRGTVFEHNITMLTICMREGEKKGLALPDAKIDDSMLVGQAYLLKRLAQLVQSTNEELQQKNEQLLKMAITDELTQLYNRREMEKRINAALDNVADSKNGVGLIMVDVDHFKKVNDILGHDVGDKVLRKVADILKAAVDPAKGEAVGRWGGEEFFMLLPDMSLEDTAALAENTRKAIEENRFENVRRLTASFGVIHSSSDSDRKNLYIKVDEALYQAKARGRNCVITADN